MILEIVIAVISVPIIYVLFEYIAHILKLNDYPPGPFPLPVIGNLHLMSTKPYETFRDLAKKYGDVFSISFGMQRLVIVNKIGPAREALITKGSDFAGRPDNSYTINMLSRGYKDIAFSDFGPYWVLNRKLGHAALKMYGDGMGNLEKKVVYSSEELHKRLRENGDVPVDVHMEYGLSTLNIICSIVFGEQYKREDEDFVDAIEFSNLITSGFSNGDPVAFIPWLRFFPLDGLKKLKQGIKIRDTLLHKKLKEHRATFDADNIRDFTDSLIKSSMDCNVWENVGVKNVTDDHLEMILFDIFVGGTETAATTLRWVTVYLLHWPHIQDEVYNEIISKVGLDRYPELKDRSNLNFTQATIQETLRLSSLVPLGAPHKAIKDSSIGGKNVPKDTQILFNLWNYHHDPSEWENPEHFDPHRWLDDEGIYIPGRHKSFLPFSAGRRVCLGESMAKTELFLFFSRLLRDFKIEENPNESLPSLEGRVGVTLAPHPFSAIFTPRKHVLNK